jgi:hypothetical protein
MDRAALSSSRSIGVGGPTQHKRGLGCWHSSVDRYVQPSEAVLGVVGQLALHRVGSKCADTGGAKTGGGKKAESGMMTWRYWNTSVPTDRTAACSLVSVLGICQTLAAVAVAALHMSGSNKLVLAKRYATELFR